MVVSLASVMIHIQFAIWLNVWCTSVAVSKGNDTYKRHVHALSSPSMNMTESFFSVLGVIVFLTH